MWEIIATVAIVAAVLVLAARSLYRVLTGKDERCACGSSPRTCGKKTASPCCGGGEEFPPRRSGKPPA